MQYLAAACLFTLTNISVVDGDTIKAVINPFPDIYYMSTIRISGIDTPEIHSKSPCEKAMAEDAKRLLVELMTSKGTYLTAVEGKDAFGRVLGEVRTELFGPVSEVLTKAGLARPYKKGGKRVPWCQD